MLPKLLLIAIICCLSLYTHGQDSAATTLDKITRFPTRFITNIEHKAASLEDRLVRQTTKYLQRLSRKEARLKKALYKADSNMARNLFAADPALLYAKWIDQMKSGKTAQAGKVSGEYMPYIDSLQGTLAFLDKNPQLLSSSGALPADIQKSLGQLQQLQGKMQDAGQIKQFIQQRKDQIKRYLSQNTQLPGRVKSLYADYNKELYYYNQQIREYRDILNDPDKMMKTALRLLNKLPAFTDFMKKNSMLAGLFNMPGNAGLAGAGAQSVAGLQTRDQVIAALQNQLGQAGPNVNSLIQQNLAGAQDQVSTLTNNLSGLGNNGADMDMPDFKPNNQKTKSFLQRLEYSTNLQTTKSSYFFPTTTDLALTIGYKLNDKNIIGIGASYKMGWGKDIRHIAVTSEGMGIRSFLDVKLKGSFYASGGFEYNYQESGLPPASSGGGGVGQPSNWRESGLVGISKIVSLKTKVFKKTNIQLLWDFLSYRQVPATPALKLRVGYSF
jgi:hypothetical protein